MAEILCSIEQAVRELVDVMRRCGNKKVNESRRQWNKFSWQGRNKVIPHISHFSQWCTEPRSEVKLLRGQCLGFPRTEPSPGIYAWGDSWLRVPELREWSNESHLEQGPQDLTREQSLPAASGVACLVLSPLHTIQETPLEFLKVLWAVVWGTWPSLGSKLSVRISALTMEIEPLNTLQDEF